MRRARACVCVCVYKLRYVRVAFSISHTPGGHLSPEAKSHFGRAWLSIMYNRDTSAPRWDRCLPSTCLAFRPAECRRLCPPRARYVAFRLPGTNMSTDRFIVHAACSLAIHAVSVGGPRWLHVTLSTETWSRKELSPFNAKTFRLPLLLLDSPALLSDLFFSRTSRKESELLVRFFLSSSDITLLVFKILLKLALLFACGVKRVEEGEKMFVCFLVNWQVWKRKLS